MQNGIGSEQLLEHLQQPEKDMEVIVSVTGNDNEEIIITLSEIINRFSGRLQASRFNRLDTSFNGLFYVSINIAYFGAFRACLESLNSERLNFEFSPAKSESSNGWTDNDKICFEVEFFGLKEQVIDVKLLRVLASNQLVIDEMSRKRYISESGKAAYKARLQVSTDFILDVGEIERELQLKAEELNIHAVIHFDEDDLQEAI